MITIIVPLYGYINSRIKKLWNLRKVAKRRHLTISNLDEIGVSSLALDVAKRKLLYAKKTTGAPSCLIIDLQDLDSCSITRQYKSIRAGELDKRRLPEFLNSISLNLHFLKHSRVVSLPLYDAEKDHPSDIETIEAKAERWEGIVSLLVPSQIMERA